MRAYRAHIVGIERETATPDKQMTYKVRITPPKSFIEGWNGSISVDGGQTWIRLTKYMGGGLVSFDSKDQLLKEAARTVKCLAGR
jgi:hypothetical protein